MYRCFTKKKEKRMYRFIYFYPPNNNVSMFIDQLGPIMLLFSSAFHVVEISYYRVPNGTVSRI